MYLCYSLIKSTSHWMLISMFSCEFAVDNSIFCLFVRLNSCSGSGESTRLNNEYGEGSVFDEYGEGSTYDFSLP